MKLLLIAVLLIFPLGAKSHPARLRVLDLQTQLRNEYPNGEGLIILNTPSLKTSFKPLHAIQPGSWNSIRATLLSKKWQEKGTAFAQNHKALLNRGEKEYPGISRWTVIGVLSIETKQGEFLGDWSALHVLYKRWRSRVAGSQQDLLHMIEFCVDNAIADCVDVPGSRTGAIGISQFRPENLPLLGARAHGRGMANLFNYDDAILSTFRFLAYYNDPIHCHAKTHRTYRNNPVRHVLVHYLGARYPYQDIVEEYGNTLQKGCLSSSNVHN